MYAEREASLGLDRLIVIGGGNMARAILGGAIAKKVLSPGELIVIEPDAHRLQFFQDQGIQGFTSIGSIRDRLTPDAAVLLAVKPQVLGVVAESIAPARFGGLVISILAGMGSERVRAAMGGECRVVRVMPNTPALIGVGVAGICVGAGAGPADVEAAERLFGSVGRVVRVREADMNAVTAVSGSGPAYVFLLAQAMIEGGLAAGLDAQTSRTLTIQTIRGAAEMLIETTDTPEVLRKGVTSPGGTTQAAIEVMESASFRQTVVRAVLAARDRGAELGR